MTLHDDHVAGIATVLRYLVHPFEAGSRDLRLSVSWWWDLKSDLPISCMPATSNHLLLLAIFTAEKYMVPDLRQIAVQELSWICVIPSCLGADYTESDIKQELFLQEHYARSKSMWEGEYPKVLYQVFGSVLGRSRQRGGPCDKIEAVARQDEGLKTYLIGDGGFYDLLLPSLDEPLAETADH